MSKYLYCLKKFFNQSRRKQEQKEITDKGRIESHEEGGRKV